MILSDFVLPSRINQFCLETGIDSIKLCPDKHRFKTFEHEVSYHFGIKTSNWVVDKIQQCSWTKP